MEATQALTGHGGWPMTVFLDAGRAAVLRRHLLPARAAARACRRSGSCCEAIADGLAGSGASDGRSSAAARITAAARGARSRPSRVRAAAPSRAPTLDAAASARWRATFDAARGGFGGAPKFPPSMVLEFLLRHHARTGDARCPRRWSRGTCEAMARGGIYDQLGGGFARYCVDADWVVPHFEKMLYDNALLLRAYAALVAGHRRSARPSGSRGDRATSCSRELRTPRAASPPRSTPTPRATRALLRLDPGAARRVLGADDGAWAAELLGVTAGGHLRARRLDAAAARRSRRRRSGGRRTRARCWRRASTRAAAGPRRQGGGRLERPRDRRAGRGRRAARASRPGSRPRWRRPTCSCACTSATGPAAAGLARRVGRARTPGCSRTTPTWPRASSRSTSARARTAWLDLAGVLLDVVLAHFRDGEGGFFDTADDAEALVPRPQDPTDNADPVGLAAAAGALLTYAALTGSSRTAPRPSGRWASVARDRDAAPAVRRLGPGGGRGRARRPREVAVVGAPTTPALRAAADRADAAPPRAGRRGGGPGARPRATRCCATALVGGRAAAYVCRRFVCDAPVTSVEELAELVAAR